MTTPEQRLTALQAAVQEVLEGTLLDNRGNRNDDGMDSSLRFGGSTSAISVKHWVKKLEEALTSSKC